MIDAYLDGLLDEDDRRALERRMEAEPALREAAELQRRIDEALCRSFGVETAPRMAAPKPKPRVARRVWAYAAAAAIVFAAAVVVLIQSLQGPATQPWKARPPAESFASAYQQELDAGFTPGWVCETDQEFADTFDRYLGQPLVLTAAPGVEALGLSLKPVQSRRTMAVLARVDGEPVIVFVVRPSPDQAPPPRVDEGLNIFPIELDGVAAYEVTPLDQPRVLELLKEP